MKELEIEPREDQLSISCKHGEIAMKGNSILADPIKFFKPVKEWVEEYLKNPAEQTEIHLIFDYVDTASVQSVFDVLKMFMKLPDYQRRVHVHWHFEFDDPELLEVGEIMETRLKLKFNFVEIKPKKEE